MKISILDAVQIPNGQTSADALRNAISLAVAADRLGFERYWVVEHHGVACEAPSAPEVLIPILLQATRHIRVGAGGILLDHHSPYKVAVNFRILDALFPQRVDLGIGHAPTGEHTDLALKQDRASTRAYDHQTSVVELMQWLGDEIPTSSPLHGAHIMPDVAGGPLPWILSASQGSVEFAARNGLALAFSAFHAPHLAQQAFRTYFETFEPSSFSAGLAEPRAMLALRVIVGETEREAERLAMSLRYRRQLRTSNGIYTKQLPPLDEMIREFGSVIPRERGEWPPFVIGSAEQVRERIEAMMRQTGAHEVIVQDFIHDHQARLHSYDLLASVFELRR